MSTYLYTRMRTHTNKRTRTQMVRSYKRKTEIGHCSDERLRAAVEAVHRGQSLNAASNEGGISIENFELRNSRLCNNWQPQGTSDHAV